MKPSIILIIIFFLIAGILSAFVILKQGARINCGDGFCDTDAGEYPGICPDDCRGIIVEPCGDGICGKNELTETCPQDCGDLQKETNASGGSHFGVHLDFGSVDRVAPYIRELGDVYVRAGTRDTVGWAVVKESGRNIPLCRSCCVSPPSPGCGCGIGEKFYCNLSREVLLERGQQMDVFNAGLKMHATVGANRYDGKPPEFLTAAYPAGNEQVYREFLDVVVGNLSAGGRVRYWGIENEAQAPMFWSGGAQGYADLALLASGEIKSLCPKCKVGISLGTPEPGEKWTEAMSGICDSIDFLDLHYPRLEENVLDRWKTECPGIEIISTESGLADFEIKGKRNASYESKWGGSPEAQARDLIKYNSILFHAGYGQIFWFAMDFDWDPNTEDDFWEHAGLLTKGYAKKPAFTAYRTMIGKVDHFISVTRLGVGQYKYSFSEKHPVYILWCDSGACTLPGEITGAVEVTDYLGYQETKDASEIVIGDSPIFVERA